jgi:hypothetical protein
VALKECIGAAIRPINQRQVPVWGKFFLISGKFCFDATH